MALQRTGTHKVLGRGRRAKSAHEHCAPACWRVSGRPLNLIVVYKIQWGMNLGQVIQSISSIITAIGVIVGFYIAYRQLKNTAQQTSLQKKAAQAEFLLDFDKMLDRYDQIHKNLRPGGSWCAKEMEFSPEQWAEIERYMGLFERISILIDDNFISIDVFNRLYGYRLINIRENPTINREKLKKRAHGWKDFLKLLEAVEKVRAKDNT